MHFIDIDLMDIHGDGSRVKTTDFSLCLPMFGMKGHLIIGAPHFRHPDIGEYLWESCGRMDNCGITTF